MLVYPTHLVILVLIQFCQTIEVSQCVSFGKTSIQLPPLAQQRASCPTRSSGAKRPPKFLLRKEHFSFPSLKSSLISKLASYSEVIKQWGCSLYSSRKLLQRVILSAVLWVGQSYIFFQRTGRSTAALWNAFWIPLILSGSHFILYFTFLHTARSSIPISFSVVL